MDCIEHTQELTLELIEAQAELSQLLVLEATPTRLHERSEVHKRIENLHMRLKAATFNAGCQMAFDELEALGLKVWRIGPSQNRVVAAKNKTEAARLLNVSRSTFANFGGETMNAAQVVAAASNPGKVFIEQNDGSFEQRGE